MVQTAPGRKVEVDFETDNAIIKKVGEKLRDIFYLCTKKIDIIEIYHLLLQKNIKCTYYSEFRTIQYLDEGKIIDLTAMKEDEFDEFDNRIFREKEIKTIINITYNIAGISEIKKFFIYF